MNIFLSTLIALIYAITGYRLLLKSQMTAIYKHPLFFYTTIVLALMVICFKVVGAARTIMLLFSLIILIICYFCLMYTPSTFGLM